MATRMIRHTAIAAPRAAAKPCTPRTRWNGASGWPQKKPVRRRRKADNPHSRSLSRVLLFHRHDGKHLSALQRKLHPSRLLISIAPVERNARKRRSHLEAAEAFGA